MTSVVNYRRTGRIVIAGYAWYKFGASVRQGNILQATAWGVAATEATVGIFVPDPVAYALGYVLAKVGGKVGSRVGTTWGYNRAFFARYASVPYSVPVTVALVGRTVLEDAGFYQQREAEREEMVAGTSSFFRTSLAAMTWLHPRHKQATLDVA